MKCRPTVLAEVTWLILLIITIVFVPIPGLYKITILVGGVFSATLTLGAKRHQRRSRRWR